MEIAGNAALAKNGARVFALDLPSAVEKVTSVDGVTYLEADVTDVGQVRSAVAAAASGPALRMVVNCAGIDRPGRVLDAGEPHDLALYRRGVEVNLVGTFN